LKSIFIYKILNNETAPNLKEIFLKISDYPIIHQLRNSQTDLVLPFPKSQFKKKTFSYSGATLWNNLSITAHGGRLLCILLPEARASFFPAVLV
jgi:hypothetical protein